jgi:hypothetical protein
VLLFLFSLLWLLFDPLQLFRPLLDLLQLFRFAAEPVYAAVPSAAGAASDSLAPAKPVRLLFAAVVSGANPVDDRSFTSCIHLPRRRAISSRLLFAPVVYGAHPVDDRSLTSCIHLRH